MAPAGGDAHMPPATLWSLLDGGAAEAGGAGGPAAPLATLTPPLASFAPPKPVQRAFWNLAVQRPRLRSQSPPRTRSPPGGGAPAGAPHAERTPPHTPAAGMHAAPRRARSGTGEQPDARSEVRGAVPRGAVEACGGGGEARLSTWEPRLQPQVGGASPAGWAMSNRVTVANPQKGFRNRCAGCSCTE